MQEDIQRYVMFARQFKPKIREDSAEFMVEEYKRLRQRDSSGEAIYLTFSLNRDCFRVLIIARGYPVVVANHGASTGEHDPSVGGDGATVV